MNTPGLPSRIRGAYALLVRIASSFRSPLLLILRLYWGWSFFVTGKGKLENLTQTAENFTNFGIPYPMLNAVLAGTTECVGGLFLLAGLASRLTSIPLIITMLVAYLTAEHAALAGFFSDQDAFISSAPLTYLLVALIVFIFGPGAFSLDFLIGKKFAAAASAPSSPPQSA